MPDAKKYMIAGKEFTLKFPNYAVREAARDYEYQYPTWYLYRNETLGYRESSWTAMSMLSRSTVSLTKIRRRSKRSTQIFLPG